MDVTRRWFGSAALTAAAFAAAGQAAAQGAGPVKVGILHSLSGTMAISETDRKSVV